MYYHFTKDEYSMRHDLIKDEYSMHHHLNKNTYYTMQHHYKKIFNAPSPQRKGDLIWFSCVTCFGRPFRNEIFYKLPWVGHHRVKHANYMEINQIKI